MYIYERMGEIKAVLVFAVTFSAEYFGRSYGGGGGRFGSGGTSSDPDQSVLSQPKTTVTTVRTASFG